MSDTGCPICGKFGGSNHKCTKRAMTRWENIQIERERALREEPERTIDDRLEEAERMLNDDTW